MPFLHGIFAVKKIHRYTERHTYIKVYVNICVYVYVCIYINDVKKKSDMIVSGMVEKSSHLYFKA